MTYLINDTYLFENTLVSSTKNTKEILVAFKEVTLIDIKPLLGIPLYELYERHVETNSTLSTEQSYLFELIKFYMAMRVQHKMMFNLINLGLKGATEEDNAANIQKVITLRQEVNSNSHSIKSQILSYLNANKNIYPEYYPQSYPNGYPGSNASDVTVSVYTSGILFDDDTKKQNYIY